MPPSADGELLNDQELAELDSQMEAIAQEKKQCEQGIHQSRLQDDPEPGVFFAQEIFANQQEKLRLQLEIDLCRAKKKYLLSKAKDG